MIKRGTPFNTLACWILLGGAAAWAHHNPNNPCIQTNKVRTCESFEVQEERLASSGSASGETCVPTGGSIAHSFTLDAWARETGSETIDYDHCPSVTQPYALRIDATTAWSHTGPAGGAAGTPAGNSYNLVVTGPGTYTIQAVATYTPDGGGGSCGTVTSTQTTTLVVSQGPAQLPHQSCHDWNPDTCSWDPPASAGSPPPGLDCPCDGDEADYNCDTGDWECLPASYDGQPDHCYVWDPEDCEWTPPAAAGSPPASLNCPCTEEEHYNCDTGTWECRPPTDPDHPAACYVWDSATCAYILDCSDPQLPAFDPLPETTVECDEWPPADSGIPAGGCYDVIPPANPGAPDCSNTHTVTWTIVHKCGPVATLDQVVHVVDTTPPEITACSDRIILEGCDELHIPLDKIQIEDCNLDGEKTEYWIRSTDTNSGYQVTNIAEHSFSICEIGESLPLVVVAHDTCGNSTERTFTLEPNPSCENQCGSRLGNDSGSRKRGDDFEINLATGNCVDEDPCEPLRVTLAPDPAAGQLQIEPPLPCSSPGAGAIQAGTTNEHHYPEALVQVVEQDPGRHLEVRYHSWPDAGPLGPGGIHQPTAPPVQTYTIRQKSGDPDTVEVRHHSGSTTHTTTYHRAAGGDWTVVEPGNLRHETVTSTTHPDGTRTDRHRVYDIDGATSNLVSDVARTYQPLHGADILLSQTVDPGGAALTTTMLVPTNPAAGAYHQTEGAQYPDGSWSQATHTNHGRMLRARLPWLDSPPAAPDSQVQLIDHAYTPHDPLDTLEEWTIPLPRTVTETTLGIPTAKRYHAHYTDTDGHRVTVVEQAHAPGAAYGDPANLRTVVRVHPPLPRHPWSGEPVDTVRPDGSKTTFTYERGAYTPDPAGDVPGTFTPGPGDHIRRTVTRGTTANPDGIANKTTRSTTISYLGRPQLSETHVSTGGGGFDRIGWTVYQYGPLFRLTDIHQSNGLHTHQQWGDLCCGLESITHPDGRVEHFDYDEMQRLSATTLDGRGAPDLERYHTRDAAGRVLETVTKAGGLSLTASNLFDLAGRPTAATDTRNLTTHTAYANGGRATTTTLPNTGTHTRDHYLDRRPKFRAGTATIAETFAYAVNPDGTLTTTTYTGPLGTTSPRWVRTTTDFLGRPVRSERPGFASNSIEVATSDYDLVGRIIRLTQTGRADQLLEYDATTLEQIRSGLDIDGNGTLDLAGTDRITEQETRFLSTGGIWYTESVTRLTPYTNNPTLLTTRRSLSRLTQLGGADPNMETLDYDIHGSLTRETTVYDPAAATVTTTRDVPDSTIDIVQVTSNGLLVSSTDQTGETHTYRHDALRRRTGMVDPRTGLAQTLYNTSNQVVATVDAAGHAATVTYTAYGEVRSRTDANGLATHYRYNLRGQKTHEWGATYPVVHVFDSYGQMSELHTFRDTNTPWFASTYPTVTGPPDITKWHHHPATGLLQHKEHADGHGPTYTYGPDLRLATRTWARSDTNGAPMTTTYGYDTNTGELVSIDYSDARTPDVTHTYGRFGQRLRTTDGSGTTDYGYDNQLQLAFETFTRPGYAARTLTRDRDALGRAAGLQLTGGPHPYHIDYGYDARGRFETLHSHHGETPLTATYSYLPDSHLLAGIDYGILLRTTYAYEPQRDVKTLVSNHVDLVGFPSRNISTYRYDYDPGRRRINVRNTGEAFAQPAFSLFDYNPRNEVAGSERYNGTDVTDTTSPVSAENRAYAYDPIGNRTSATEANTNTTAYTANQLNQYTATESGGATNAVYHDLDGNLTNDTDWIHEWNGENRLIRSTPAAPTNGSKMVENHYDAMGRRWKKRVHTWSGTIWVFTETRIFWSDSWNLIEEIDTAATETRHYDWGLDLSLTMQGAGGVGGLLRQNLYTAIATNTHQHLYDANGNVGQLLAQSGTLTSSYEYDAFGKTTRAIDTFAYGNSFQFSTKYFDVESELVDFGVRHLSFKTGRWKSRDRINEAGGLNLYAMVLNNPIGLIDPIGEEWYYFRSGMEINLIFLARLHVGGTATRAEVEAWASQMQNDVQNKDWCPVEKFQIKTYLFYSIVDQTRKEYNRDREPSEIINDKWTSIDVHPASFGNENALNVTIATHLNVFLHEALHHAGFGDEYLSHTRKELLRQGIDVANERPPSIMADTTKGVRRCLKKRHLQHMFEGINHISGKPNRGGARPSINPAIEIFK